MNWFYPLWFLRLAKKMGGVEAPSGGYFRRCRCPVCRRKTAMVDSSFFVCCNCGTEYKIKPLASSQG